MKALNHGNLNEKCLTTKCSCEKKKKEINIHDPTRVVVKPFVTNKVGLSVSYCLFVTVYSFVVRLWYGYEYWMSTGTPMTILLTLTVATPITHHILLLPPPSQSHALSQSVTMRYKLNILEITIQCSSPPAHLMMTSDKSLILHDGRRHDVPADDGQQTTVYNVIIQQNYLFPLTLSLVVTTPSTPNDWLTDYVVCL